MSLMRSQARGSSKEVITAMTKDKYNRTTRVLSQHETTVSLNPPMTMSQTLDTVIQPQMLNHKESVADNYSKSNYPAECLNLVGK